MHRHPGLPCRFLEVWIVGSFQLDQLDRGPKQGLQLRGQAEVAGGVLRGGYGLELDQEDQAAGGSEARGTGGLTEGEEALHAQAPAELDDRFLVLGDVLFHCWIVYQREGASNIDSAGSPSSGHLRGSPSGLILLCSYILQKG